MPYIGHNPTNAGSFIFLDDISSSFNGSATEFNLAVGGVAITPNTQNLLIALDGVIQQAPDAYTVSGSSITFTAAVPASTDFYGILMGQSASIGQGTIGADELKITGNGTNGQLLKTDGDGSFSYLSTSSITSVGTLTALTVDDMTLNGSTISDGGAFDIDAGGVIKLDAGGGQIQFFDDGTEIGVFENSSTNFVMESKVQDKDIIFKGNDGGSGITALTLDMSAGGDATFAGDTTTFPVGGILRFGERGNLTHNSSNYNMTFNTNSLLNAMTVTGTGNVLIGTTDDDARLMVKKVDGTSYGQFVTIEGDTTDNNNYSGISFKAGTLANAYPEIGVSNGGLMFQMSGGYHSSNYNNRTKIQLNGSDGHILFMTGGDPATEKMKLNAGGLLTIGTSGFGSAGTTLKELGLSWSTSTDFDTTNTGTFPGMAISNPHGDEGTGAGIQFSHGASSSGISYIVSRSERSTSNGGDRSSLHFGTRGSDGVARRLLIGDDGNATFSGRINLRGTKLIGEHATSNRRLQLQGSGDGYMLIGAYDDNEWGYVENVSMNNGMYFNVSNGAFNFDTGHIRPYTDNEISLGEGNARFVNCHLINNPSVTSDKRRKAKIKKSSLGLEFLNKLNPVQYKWKDYAKKKRAKPDKNKEFTDEIVKHTYKRTHYGLIAQEVEKVVADSGMTNDDFAPLVYDKETDTYGMMYGEYVGILIKAVQELSAKVEALENA